MNRIKVTGGIPLHGEVELQGSKNATLPVLAATVLVPGQTVLYHCPNISDVMDTISILENLGCVVNRNGDSIWIDSSWIHSSEVVEDIAANMRSSMMLLGALLGRMGKASVRYPGGCVIGKRPVDLHLKALRSMGAVINEDSQLLSCQAEHLHGAVISFPTVSVGATENVILASVLADGITVIKNAACEPEICTLCQYLNLCGAKIKGAGSKTLHITGVKELYPCTFRIPADRIVAGTYLIAAAVSRGKISVNGLFPEEIASVLQTLRDCGCHIETGEKTIRLRAPERLRSIPYLETDSYPGFPTDLQSQMTALLCVADGTGMIRETIFEKRFWVVPELKRMGARIEISGDMLLIEGVKKLSGCSVVAEELRGSAALLIAGLAAEGITILEQTRFLKRGYQDLPGTFKMLGADIMTE